MKKTGTNRPAPEIVNRLFRCRREMRKHRINAYLLSDHHDYLYLTGFTGDECAVIVTLKDVHMISDGRFDEQLDRECPWAVKWMRRGTLNEEITKACKSLKVRSLGFQSSHLTVGNKDAIQKLMRSTRLAPAPPILPQMRRWKDAHEIAIMTKAIRIAEEAFEATRKTIRVGQTELEMAARLEYEMKKRGASGPAFPTICAEGANAALPHAHAGNRKVKKGSAILFDWGARYNGYNSDLTRMVFVDSIPTRIGEIYRITLEAQLRAIRAIRPGVRMCDVDAVARGYITERGFGKAFSHGLGHGLGIDVHELPSLSWRSEEKLEADMVVTVEPGIYLPGLGGVRIEDDICVTSKGCRVLSRLSKTLEEAVI